MTRETDLIRRFDEVGIVFSAMYVMTTEARHSTPVHQTLNEIITLHSILVSRPVGKVHEVGLAQFVIFEPPKVPQIQALLKTYRPVVVQDIDRIIEGLAL